MRTMGKWRIGIALALLLFMVIAAARRWGGGSEPPGVRLLPDAPAEPAGSRGPGADREHVAPLPQVLEGCGAVTVRVETEPADCDLEWHADLYAMTAPEQVRERLATAVRRGTGELTWEIPSGFLGEPAGVHVWSDGSAEESWTVVRPTPERPGRVVVTLPALGCIRGHVRAADGTPLSGARVAFAPPAGERRRNTVPPRLRRHHVQPNAATLTAETDAEGAFRVEDVDPAMTYTGAAACPGHAVRREYGVAARPGVETAVDFTLPDGCRVTGRLLDSSGRPVADVRLRVATPRDESNEAGIVWEPEGEAVTQEDGRFVLDCLAPGWKKVQTILAAEKGSTAVGHWECRLAAGERRNLGDLALRDSLFEARIVVPDDGDGPFHVSFGFFPVAQPGVSPDGAATGGMLLVPVEPDDGGVIRVRGLPPGEVRAFVLDRKPREDGRWRPRTDFEPHFDGGTERVEWRLLPLLDEKPAEVDDAGRPVHVLQVRLPKAGADALALLFRGDELVALQTADGGSLSVEAAAGARMRVVVCAGGRWGEQELELEADATVAPEIRTDRAGNTLEIRVRDGSRPVPRAMVLLGPSPEALLPLRLSDAAGRVSLSGLPPDVSLFVSAAASPMDDPPEPQAVTWSGGRATVEIDVGAD